MTKVGELLKKHKILFAGIGVALVVIGIVLSEYNAIKPSLGTLPNFTVSTLKVTKIENSTPSSSLTIESINPRATIDIEFSDPIDITALQINTKPSIELKATQDSATKLVLSPTTSWDYSQKYTLSLKGIKSEGGTVVTQPFEFTVEFAYPSPEKSIGF